VYTVQEDKKILVVKVGAFLRFLGLGETKRTIGERRSLGLLFQSHGIGYISGLESPQFF
jgi:hypothetical protein